MKITINLQSMLRTTKLVFNFLSNVKGPRKYYGTEEFDKFTQSCAFDNIRRHNDYADYPNIVNYNEKNNFCNTVDCMAKVSSILKEDTHKCLVLGCPKVKKNF